MMAFETDDSGFCHTYQWVVCMDTINKLSGIGCNSV